MKAFAITVIVGLLLVACSGEKEYQTKVRQTADSIVTYSEQCSFRASKLVETWQSAISAGSNFNDALAADVGLWRAGGLDSIFTVRKEFVEKNMKELSDPPSKSTELHKKLVELYGSYSQMYDYSLKPSGSLLTYRSGVIELDEKIGKLKNEMSVMYAE